MIALLIGVAVGWILLTAIQLRSDGTQTATWVTLLSVGTASLVLLVVGTVIYLVLSIKAINVSRRQSNFMDSVTHELKSPIASLKLYLQTLDRRSVDEEQRESFYKFMLADVERLDHLINHVLQAARLERSTRDETSEVVDLTQLLQKSAEAVCARYRVPENTIKLDLVPCWVASNPVDMDLVFRNLLDNAVKYAGEPPEVRVTLVHQKSGKALVTVRDNGAGIPKKLRSKIFARFVRLGSELQRKKPGTGLGLYIVRTLVAKWKGQVKVREADSGTGTVFEVELTSTQSVPPSRKGSAPATSPNGEALNHDKTPAAVEKESSPQDQTELTNQ